MEVVSKGSVESLLVPLRDRLGNVESISTLTNPMFYVRKKDDNSAVQPDTAVTFDTDYPMTAICALDTTLATYVADEEYKLYLKFGTPFDNPILGPVFFRVVSD